MNKKRCSQWLAAVACGCLAAAGVQCASTAARPAAQRASRVLRLADLKPGDSRLMPGLLGNKKIDHGGVYIFQPGETAHPEPRHVHDTAEVFLIIQGKGVIPIDGVEYPVKTGDVVVVMPGEDHHTRSSVDDPLVTAWYVMEE